MRQYFISLGLVMLVSNAHADLRGAPILPANGSSSATSSSNNTATSSSTTVSATALAATTSTATASTSSAYTVRAVTLASGTIEREYLTTAGTVFAVTWSGPFMPDLVTLFGQTAYDQYVAALQTAQASNTARRKGGPVDITGSGLTVQMTGHQRAMVGRAYVASLIPSGVSLEDIQ